MQAVSALSPDGFRSKGSIDTVSLGNCAYHIFVSDKIVVRAHGVGSPEVDLVLSRTVFVMGGFRLNSHLLQAQTDLPADILPPIQRRYVKITALIPGFPGRTPLLIGLEEIEFAL